MKKNISSYVEAEIHEEFTSYAENIGKSVSQLVKELVLATIENRIKLTPKKPIIYSNLYDLRD